MLQIKICAGDQGWLQVQDSDPKPSEKSHLKNRPARQVPTVLGSCLYIVLHIGRGFTLRICLLRSQIDTVPNIYKDTKPWTSAFLKNWPVKVLCGRCLSARGPLPSYDPVLPPPPPCTLYTYSHREGGEEGGELTRKKVGGAMLHKAGRKFQHKLHNWLYLQSINSIKHQ